MIRILHIIPVLDGGGVENLLLNYYTHINRDNFVFDFIVHGKKLGILESVFEGMGSKIFHIPTKHESFIQNLIAMKRIISSGNYDVIHAHQREIGAFPMYFAKRAGIKVRIMHSHMAHMKENYLHKTINRFLQIYLKQFSTDWFACSIDAGRSLWGDKETKNGMVHIMNNAIDIEEFRFNASTRHEIRKELGIEGKFVIGTVGRLSYQKNHEFLIKIFMEVQNKNSNTVLLVVGRGELEDEIKKQVFNLGLSEKVKFLGVHTDVPQLLQAMDVFLLPSRFEGLGIVFIEAQAAGLVSFGSDVVVPRESKVTELMNFISLDESTEYWAEEILKYQYNYERKNMYKEIQHSGYEIKQEAKILERFYEKRVNE